MFPLVSPPPLQIFVCARQGSPALGAANAIRDEAVLALGRHQCLCGSRAETAVVRDAEEPLQHNCSRAVSSSLAALGGVAYVGGKAVER